MVSGGKGEQVAEAYIYEQHPFDVTGDADSNSNEVAIDDKSMPVMKKIGNVDMKAAGDDMKCIVDFKSGIYISLESLDISTTKIFGNKVLKRIGNCDFNSYVLVYLEFEHLIYLALEKFHDCIHRVGTGGNNTDKNNDNNNDNNNDTNSNNNNSNNNNSNNNQNNCNHNGNGNNVNGNHNGSDDSDDDDDDDEKKRKIKLDEDDDDDSGNDEDETDSDEDIISEDNHKIKIDTKKNGIMNMNTNSNEGEHKVDTSNNNNKEQKNQNNKEMYNPSALSEIISLRGVCNCSGHCGNSIIKISILFYKDVLNGKLDFNTFNKNVLPQQARVFWETFINQFIFNNDIGMIKYLNHKWTNNNNHNIKFDSNNVHLLADKDSKSNDNSKFMMNDEKLENNGYDDDSILNRVEWFKDLLCFVFEMFDQVKKVHPKYDILDQDSWESKDNNHNWQETLQNIVNDVKSDQDRKFKIRAMIGVMFHNFKTEFFENAQYTSLINKHYDTWDTFLFSAVLKAIMIHNYSNASVGTSNIHSANNVMFKAITLVVSDVRKYLEQLQTSNAASGAESQPSHNDDVTEELHKAQFCRAVWKHIDNAMLVLLANDNMSNITLMRLLIITMNFIVECESSFDTHVKCLDFNPNEKTKQKLLKELQKFKIDTLWKQNQSSVSKIHKNPKLNAAKLSRKEISCLKLWTNENACNIIKQRHRRGETCHFRNVSEQINKALTKLKRHSQKLMENEPNNAPESGIEHVYSGIADVFVPIDSKANINNLNNLHVNDPKNRTSVEQFLLQFKDRFNVNNSDTFDEYTYLTYDTFTSTTENPVVGLAFSSSSHTSQPRNKFRGVLFVMNFAAMHSSPGLIHGSISWLSDFDNEREILVGPCRIRVHPLEKAKWDTHWPKSIDRKKYPGIELFRVQLIPLGHVSDLIRKLKYKIKNVSSLNIGNCFKDAYGQEVETKVPKISFSKDISQKQDDWLKWTQTDVTKWIGKVLKSQNITKDQIDKCKQDFFNNQINGAILGTLKDGQTWQEFKTDVLKGYPFGVKKTVQQAIEQLPQKKEKSGLIQF